jgi:hypothetical protein
MVTNPNGATSVKTLAARHHDDQADARHDQHFGSVRLLDQRFRLRRAGGRLARGRHQEPHRTKLARAA